MLLRGDCVPARSGRTASPPGAVALRRLTELY